MASILEGIDGLAMATPRKGRGSAWERVLKAAASNLGPEWVVARSGTQAELIHLPVRWWFNSIGLDPKPNREELTFSHAPLMREFTPGTITFRQSSYQPGPTDSAPPNIQMDIFDTRGAAEIVRWWALGPSTKFFAAPPLPDLVAAAEQAYADREEKPRRDWMISAGLRVIADTGSPIEVIDSVLWELARRDVGGHVQSFWRQFRAVAENRDRLATLQWLDEERRRSVKDAYGLRDSAFADVISHTEDS